MDADDKLHGTPQGETDEAMDANDEKTHVSIKEFREAAMRNIEKAAEQSVGQTDVSDINSESDGLDETDDFDVADDEIAKGGDDSGLSKDKKKPEKKSVKKSEKTPVKKSEKKPEKKSEKKPTKKDQKNKGVKRKKRLTREQILARRRYVRFAKLLGLLLIALCAGVVSYGFATVPENVVGRNVYIEDVNVSGMTSEQAKAAISDKVLLQNRDITLSCKGQTCTISGADVGLAPRVDDTVAKAMRYGKSGNVIVDGIVNTVQLFARHTVVPNASITEDILREDIAEFGRQIYGQRVEHQLEIGSGVVICTPGHTGFDENTDTAYEEILDALEREKFNSIDITLNAGAPADLTVDTLDAFVYCDPIDAHYEYADGTVYVADDVNGRYLDLDEAAQLVPTVREGGEVVYIPYVVSYASVTAAMLSEKLFDAEIGSYSTNYGSSNANRCANIANAASKIDGVVIAPGDVFSFNDTVGPRSVANGFYTAKEYMNGQTVDGIGGGTCQVSSTLYNAVLYSDLSIISRTNHMFTVGYCPDGQDATVSDTGIDFKFMNSMDYPIKISAVTSGYTITVSIIGTQRDDPRTVQITNSTTPVGNDKSVHSVRYVYNSAGELIQTDDLGNSYYMAHK